MSLLERVVRALLYLCAIAFCFFLCLWVLSSLGIMLPTMVITILKVMFVLIAILILIRLFYPIFSGVAWW